MSRSVPLTPGDAERAATVDEWFAQERATFASHRETIVALSLYRRIPWSFTQPHSFRVFLWRNIDPADFRLASGKWIDDASDVAYFLPLLELAGGRAAMLDEVHYQYHVYGGNSAARFGGAPPSDAPPTLDLFPRAVRPDLGAR